MLLQRLVIFGGCLGFGFPALAGLGSVPISEGVGEIQFSQTLKDFGVLHRGEKVAFDFPFENIGKGALIIQGVHSACGCTAAEADRGRVYVPGEKGSIKVTLDTGSFSGPLAKLVTVMTNEHLLPSRSLTVKALVEDEVSVYPPVVDFGIIQPGLAPTKQVVVKPVGRKSVLVDHLQYNKEAFEVAIAQKDDAWIIDIKLKDTLKPGYLKETLHIHNDSKWLPDLPVLVRAEVTGSIYSKPNYLEFGAIRPQASVTKLVELVGQNNFEIAGTKIELNINGELVEEPDSILIVGGTKGAAAKKQIVIDLKNIAKRPGSVHGRLVFLTSDPLQKDVGFDFYAFFQE